MESKHLTLSSNKNNEYGCELAYRLALEQLAKIEDIEKQCRKSDALYNQSHNTITLGYFNQSCVITLPPNVDISLEGKEEPVPLREKVLILHYFLQAKGTPLSNKTISYKEMVDGINYFPTFYARTIKPLVTYFGGEPQRLLDIAKTLGGYKADYGDAAVTFDAFSRVPVTWVLWKADEEFPPEGSILFDSTIPDYLTSDDIHTLTETTIWKLVKTLKAGGGNPGRN